MTKPLAKPGLRNRTAHGLALCVLLALNAPALARGGDGSGGASHGQRASPGGQVQSTHAAERHVAPIALQRLLDRHGLTDSRVLDAEIAHHGKTWIYEIKVLGVDGVVRELRYNALNGDTMPAHHE